MQTTDTVLGTPSTMGDDEQLTTTVATVAELSRALRLSGDVSVLLELQTGLRQTESRSLP